MRNPIKRRDRQKTSHNQKITKIDIEFKTYAHRIEQNQRKKFNTEPGKALKMCVRISM